MAYSISVQMSRVVCRNTESLTTGDLFAMAGGVVVTGEAKGFVLPLRWTHRNETVPFHQEVFRGFSDAPAVGLAFTAWDKDNNRKWWDNRDDIAEVEKQIDKASEEAGDPSLEAILTFVPKFVLRAVDVMVAMDLDDQLVDYSGVVHLDDVGFNPKQREVEIQFRGKDPTGYSDWDYSAFFVIEYVELPPSFGEPQFGAWLPAMSSSQDDWVGVWDGQQGDHSVTASVTAADRPGRLDVQITEKAPGAAETVVKSTEIPISKVMLEGGGYGRTLESAFPYDLAEARGGDVELGNAKSESWRTGVAANRDFGIVIENHADDNTLVRDHVITRPVGATLLRHQIGPDLLRLKEQAVLELTCRFPRSR
jgi:hypothetical protein